MTRRTHDQLRLKLTLKLLTAAQTLGATALTSSQVHDGLVEPPNPDLGDLAFGCFPLAKSLGMAPQAIAQKLVQSLPEDELIEKAQAAGPYVNVRLKAAALGQDVLSPILTGEMFKRALVDSAPKTMIEYSQPNTHKELHVGHMRNLCLGDALVRTLRYATFPVVTATFPGDVGTHVAKCLWYLKFHNQEPIPELGKGEWLGRMYSKGHLLLEDQIGTPAEEDNKQQLTLILKQLEAKQGEYYELWKTTREWSIQLMKSVYQWANVTFDHWYYESDVDAPSLKWVHELYKQAKLVESDGAIGINLESYNLGFLLLIKRDGTGLYATKDLELARRKFNDFKIERSVYVVDQRQALHFKQVFKGLEILGFPQAKDCFHLQYNFVELPDGAMSSRKGNIVPITQLIHRMQEVVKDQYLSRYKGEWSDSDIKLVAEQVAQGAIKYGMCRMDQNKKIVFDMNEWLKLEGDSGPFIQYSHARIASLLRKLGYNQDSTADWTLLSHSHERQLVRILMNFNIVAADAAINYRPSNICAYVFEVAKRFNGFYHECPVGTAETAELKTARLALAAATGLVLQKGLGLLGIPAPEKM